MAFLDFIDTLFLGYESDISKMMIYVLGMVIYSIVFWKFYTNLSKRDLMKFDLIEFDFDSPGGKFLDLVSYFFKYIIISPLLIFIWFLVILVFLSILAKSQSMYDILIIGITLIGATRITAYINEKLAEEVAKVVPIALLAIFVASPNVFSFDLVLNRFSEITTYTGLLLRFLIVIVLLEFILRVVYEIKELIVGEGGINKV